MVSRPPPRSLRSGGTSGSSALASGSAVRVEASQRRSSRPMGAVARRPFARLFRLTNPYSSAAGETDLVVDDDVEIRVRGNAAEREAPDADPHAGRRPVVVVQPGLSLVEGWGGVRRRRVEHVDPPESIARRHRVAQRPEAIKDADDGSLEPEGDGAGDRRSPYVQDPIPALQVEERGQNVDPRKWLFGRNNSAVVLLHGAAVHRQIQHELLLGVRPRAQPVEARAGQPAPRSAGSASRCR